MIGLVFRFFAALVWALLLPWRLWRRRRACPPGAWVRLDLGAELVEAPRPPRRFWARRGPGPTSLHRVRQLIDAMLVDPAPAGLLVATRGVRALAAYRQGLREELARLRAAGRPVVLWLPEGGSAAELSLAGGVGQIFVGAKTTLGPLGLRVGSIYMRRALERFGVLPEVLARGSFKTAFENLVRDDMSAAQREQLGRLLDVLYDDLVTSLATGRNVEPEQARAWIDLGLVRAEEAAKIGLIDAALYDDEVPDRLAGPPGAGTSPALLAAPSSTGDVPARLAAPSSKGDAPAPLGEGPARAARFIGAGTYLTRRLPRRSPLTRARQRLVVVEARGAIVERAPSFGGAVCDAERLTALARSLAEDDRVAAVILHVDSPGGGALASDRMHRAFTKLAARKPLVACLGGVAASGGYYIAAAAHRIVARPATMTGSIGVVAARPLLGPLLARIGAAPRYLVRGRRAEMLDPFRPLKEDERARFEADLEASYLDFLAAVAAGRGKTIDEVRPLAGGRVWTGLDALDRGLVDRLGGLHEAVEEACTKLGLAPGDLELVTAASPSPAPWSPRAWLRAALLEAAGPEAQTLEAWVNLARSYAAGASYEPVLALWAGVELDGRS